MNSITIIGAGAAGLFCAAKLAQYGLSATVIDNGKRPGRKILMSGGGKCNFTNVSTTHENYVSANPHFCKSALSRFSPWDFLSLVNEFSIPWHGREHGQLFCLNTSQDIVTLLVNLCAQGDITFRMQTQFERLIPFNDGFKIETNRGLITSQIVVVATGGLSMPALGMTPTAYKMADTLSLAVEPVRAGLVPFTLSPPLLQKLNPLSGIAIRTQVTAKNGKQFTESLLFTHRGLSGPVILQISSYWQPGEPITINLLPNLAVQEFITTQQRAYPKQTLRKALQSLLPKRLIDILYEHNEWPDLPLNQLTYEDRNRIIQNLTHWQVVPNGTEGYRTAEVTLGGISTACLSSKTLAVNTYPNLYFIGEVVDVTGWLGGFNFQWAWSSAAACAEAILASNKA